MDIKSLIETFSKHEILAEKNRREMIDSYVENNSGEPFPDWMLDDFNIASAFKLMCEEIAQLKLGFK